MSFNLGDELTPDTLRAIAANNSPVSIPKPVLSRVDDLCHILGRLGSSTPIYGRTTGVGGNKSTALDGEGHGMRLLRSHALETGTPVTPEEVRGMIAVRANQLSHPGSGVPAELLERLVSLLNENELPTILNQSAIGTGDLSALAGLGLALAGERPCDPPMQQSPFEFSSDNALPFISSSALTIARASLALTRLHELTTAAAATFALMATALDANPQHWSDAAASSAVTPGSEEAAAFIRRLRNDSDDTAPTPRVQERYGFRTFTTVHGALTSRADRLGEHLVRLMNTAQENPLFVKTDNGTVKAVHHGNFNQIELALLLDSVNLALASTCPLSESRIADVMEPSVTGLPAFAAQGPAGSSGLMILEYVAASASAEMRAAAAPVSLGTTTVSRGMEEDACFAPQAVNQLNRSLDAYTTLIGSELFAAIRVMRLRDRSSSLSPALRALWDEVKDIDTEDEDHDFRLGFNDTLAVVPRISSIISAAE